jgi:hypothetical protein
MNSNMLWPAALTLVVFTGLFGALALTNHANAIPTVVSAIVAAAAGLAHAFSLDAKAAKAKDAPVPAPATEAKKE